MDARLSISDRSLSQVDIDTARSSWTVLGQMWQSKEKLFNDLIIFLTVCPSGLGLTEVEIVLHMLPSELSAETKNLQISFYMDIFQKISHNKDSDMSESENQERQENMMDVIRSLIIFEAQNEPYQETIVKIRKEDARAFEFIMS